MAKHGKNTSLKIDNAGGTLTDISRKSISAQLSDGAELLDVTAFQATGKEYITGFRDAKISFEGNIDATLYTHLSGLLGLEDSSSFELGPEGTASGKIKLTGEGFLTKLDCSFQVNAASKFSAEFQISGGITIGTFS